MKFYWQSVLFCCRLFLHWPMAQRSSHFTCISIFLLISLLILPLCDKSTNPVFFRRTATVISIIDEHKWESDGSKIRNKSLLRPFQNVWIYRKVYLKANTRYSHSSNMTRRRFFLLFLHGKKGKSEPFIIAQIRRSIPIRMFRLTRVSYCAQTLTRPLT